MLLHRQRLILALLDCVGEPVNQTDFQKLLLLYSMECEDEPSYDFVPYQFGGFSFTSYADKRALTAKGLLEADDSKWILTHAGRDALSTQRKAEKQKVESFAAKYKDLRGDSLIRTVYRRFPYYAIRSRITHRVFQKVEDRLAVEGARPPAPISGLVTIGYEGKSLEGYLNQLLRDSVTILCDVRNNPLSRKYGFSKRVLAQTCDKVGIRYEHLPELGIPSDKRRNLATAQDYRELFEDYEELILPIRTEPLSRIKAWLGEGHRVALTCYEALPCNCHRHCVADALEKSLKKAVSVVHL